MKFQKMIYNMNISMMEKGSNVLGTKVEYKNVSKIQNVINTITVEMLHPEVFANIDSLVDDHTSSGNISQ